MLIFASGEGRLTVVPSQLNQNSNGANTVYLTGAFPSASVVTVAFTLPDGTNTEPQLMTGDKTVEYNGVTLAVKEYTLPKSITQVHGRVTVQFYIQNGSETLATEATNITVAKGVPSESTAAPENIYEQIVAALSSIQTEMTNKLDKQSGSTPYDTVYTKSASGEQKMRPTSPNINPYHIVQRDNISGVHVPYATLPEHAVPLKQFTEKLAADIAAAIATKLDIAGGTITGDLDVDGDLVVSGDFTAKGKTFIEEATTLAVKNAIIETNAGKTDLKTLLSGLVINKNPTTAYGFVYDPTDDTVKFGQGSVDENGVFTFKSGEGSPVATRADSSTFTAGHLVKWDNTKKRFVDAGKSISEVGKAPYSTMKEVENDLGLYKNPIFLNALQSISQEVITPLLPAVMDGVMDKLVTWERGRIGETKLVDVLSNDFFVFDDDSWGSVSSKPYQYLYKSQIAVTPKPYTAKTKIKWYQDVIDGEAGRYYAAFARGAASKMYAMTLGEFNKAIANTKYMPSGSEFDGFSLDNWNQALMQSQALNGVSRTQLMALGSLAGLSKILPTVGTDGAVAGIQGEIGTEFVKNGFLASVAGVDLIEAGLAVVPGTQNFEPKFLGLDDATKKNIYIMAKIGYAPMVGAIAEGSPITITFTPEETADMTIDISETLVFDIKPAFSSRIIKIKI